MLPKKLIILAAALLTLMPAHPTTTPNNEEEEISAEISEETLEEVSDLNFAQNTFAVLTGLKSKSLNPIKLVQVLGVPLALNALESLVGNNPKCQKAIMGGFDNPRQSIPIFFALVFKLAHHILPILLEERDVLAALKKGTINFATSEHLICFAIHSGLIQNQVLSLAILFAGSYLLHHKSSGIFARIEEEALAASVPGITWQVKEPGADYIMLVNPWIKVLRCVLKPSEYQLSLFLEINGDYEDVSSKKDEDFAKLTSLKSIGVDNFAWNAQDLANNKICYAIFKLIVEKLFFKRAYISPETFAALSPELQQAIKDQNQQEQNFAAYNLMNNNANYMLQLAKASQIVQKGKTVGDPVRDIKKKIKVEEAKKNIRDIKKSGDQAEIQKAIHQFEQDIKNLKSQIARSAFRVLKTPDAKERFKISQEINQNTNKIKKTEALLKILKQP